MSNRNITFRENENLVNLEFSEGAEIFIKQFVGRRETVREYGYQSVSAIRRSLDARRGITLCRGGNIVD